MRTPLVRATSNHTAHHHVHLTPSAPLRWCSRRQLLTDADNEIEALRRETQKLKKQLAAATKKGKKRTSKKTAKAGTGAGGKPQDGGAKNERGDEEYSVSKKLALAWTKSHDWIPTPVVGRKHYGFADRPPFGSAPPHAASWLLHKSCPAMRGRSKVPGVTVRMPYTVRFYVNGTIEVDCHWLEGTPTKVWHIPEPVDSPEFRLPGTAGREPRRSLRQHPRPAHGRARSRRLCGRTHRHVPHVAAHEGSLVRTRPRNAGALSRGWRCSLVSLDRHAAPALHHRQHRGQRVDPEQRGAH